MAETRRAGGGPPGHLHRAGGGAPTCLLRFGGSDRLLIALLLLLLGAGPCAPAGDAKPPEVAVRVGQSAECEGGLVIRFDEVLQDSRCPQGATCVWTGNAKVALTVTRPGGEPARVELNTHLEPRSAEVHGRTIGLLRLDPLRKVNEQVDKAAYTATLRIAAP